MRTNAGGVMLRTRERTKKASQHLLTQSNYATTPLAAKTRSSGDRLVEGQIDRQTDRQTDTHTHTWACWS